MNTIIHNIVALLAIVFIGRELWFIFGSGNSSERLVTSLKHPKQAPRSTRVWLFCYLTWLLFATLFLPRPASIIAAVYFAFNIFMNGVFFIMMFTMLFFRFAPYHGKQDFKSWMQDMSDEDAVAITNPIRTLKKIDVLISLPFLLAILFYGLDIH